MIFWVWDFGVLNLMPPNVVMGPLRLMGQAAIPLTLITLGVQLSKIKLGATLVYRRRLPYSLDCRSRHRLSLSLFLLDYTSLTSRVILLQAAGPVAATTTMLAIQFDSRPDIVSNSALITTSSAY
jgi:malate permease and related proteins